MIIRKQTLSLGLLITALLLTASLGGQAVAQNKSESKSEQLLKQIKAKYEPFTAKNSFIVMYAGKELPEISVIVIEAGPAAVILADVAAGREVGLTLEVMRKLLEFNSRADYIKASISDLGSIRVQSEQRIDLLNAAAFQEILDQIAAGADEIAVILKPARKGAASTAK